MKKKKLSPEQMEQRILELEKQLEQEQMRSTVLDKMIDLDGISSIFVSEENPMAHIEVHDLPGCDGMIQVVGDSMEPLIKQGDMVLYKTVPNRRGGLYFGHIYLLAFDLDGDEHIAVKYVYQSEIPNHYRLVSENPEHEPTDTPMSSVRIMAIVRGSGRFYGEGTFHLDSRM